MSSERFGLLFGEILAVFYDLQPKNFRLSPQTRLNILFGTLLTAD
jgi:hypothetical protein